MHEFDIEQFIQNLRNPRGNKLSAVVDCPWRTEGCVERSGCGGNCKVAASLHAAFAVSLKVRPETQDNGEKGTLTSSLEATLETKEGKVHFAF